MSRHQEEAAIIPKCTYNKGQYRSMKQNTVQTVCCEAAVTLEVRGGRQGQTKSWRLQRVLSSPHTGHSRQDKLPGSKFKMKICFSAQKNNNFATSVFKLIG